MFRSRGEVNQGPEARSHAQREQAAQNKQDDSADQIDDARACTEPVPEQAELQQYPSTQNALAHWPAAEQACPFFFLHCPAASHVLAPAHESGSSAFMTGEHDPDAPLVLQAWHVPQLSDSQHTPSVQNPVSQVVIVPQPAPRV